MNVVLVSRSNHRRVLPKKTRLVNKHILIQTESDQIPSYRIRQVTKIFDVRTERSNNSAKFVYLPNSQKCCLSFSHNPVVSAVVLFLFLFFLFLLMKCMVGGPTPTSEYGCLLRANTVTGSGACGEAEAAN